MRRLRQRYTSTGIARALMTILIGTVVIGGCRQQPQQVLSGGPKGQFGNGKQTLDYVDKLTFVIAGIGDSTLVADFACADATKCPPNGSVRLMFMPEENAYKVDWAKNVKKDADGDVVAAVMNVDKIPFPDLNLAPGERAYAWVGQIGPDADKDRGFAVYKLNADGFVGGGPWSVTPKGPKLWTCENAALRSKPAIHRKHADGEKCKELTASNGLSLGIATAYAATTASTAMQPIEGSLWISCSLGCCEVGGIAYFQ